MLKATLRSVAGHKLRFVLTAMSVVLGVAFVAGTFVLTDSIRNTFDGLVDQGTEGLAVVVRGEDSDNGRAPVPLELAADLRDVEGVSSSVGSVEGTAVLIGADGTAVRNGGAPTFGFSDADIQDAFVLGEGRLPESADEVTVERRTLELSGLSVGDTTEVVAGQEVRPVTVVGVVDFGEEGSLAGATAVLFDEATALDYFAPDGLVPSINIEAEDGVEEAVLAERVAAVLPAGAQAITGEQAGEEASAEIREALGFVSGFLLGFAAIALFVGAFIIVNTFTMLVAQRTRELALLRALGASRRQVTRSVVGEALIVGVVSSVLGLGLGVGLAVALKAVLGGFGLEIGSELSVAPRTVIASFAVGIFVTLVSAYFPARRAAKVPPVAAMRDDVAMPERSLRLRAALGVALALVGAATLIGGLIADGTVSAALVGVVAPRARRGVDR